MSALPPDYDTDPDRWRSLSRDWSPTGDVHEPVAGRLAEEGLVPVLDLGCGQGRLAELLVADWVGVDASPTQLADCEARPVVRADANALPFRGGSFGGVAALWVLYHLDRPVDVLREVARVLRPGGTFVACTSSRRNDPELVDSYPATTFDAEEAADIVARVFGEVEVERWDDPLTVLPDRNALIAYARSHHLPAAVVDRVATPVTLTKRGCLVWAKRR